MTLSQQKITCGFQATVTPARGANADNGVVGSNDSFRPTTANNVFSSKITAAADANAATMVVATGVITASTGSPVIEKTAVDFEGGTLATSAKIHAIRFITKTTMAGTVTLTGSSAGMFPAITLGSDMDVTVKFPLLGTTLNVAHTIIFTFSKATDYVIVELLGQTA